MYDVRLNKTLSFIGWGDTQAGGPTSDVLLEIEVSVADNEDCNTFYEGINDITEGMICAKVEDGKGTCNVSSFYSN